MGLHATPVPFRNRQGAGTRGWVSCQSIKTLFMFKLLHNCPVLTFTPSSTFIVFIVAKPKNFPHNWKHTLPLVWKSTAHCCHPRAHCCAQVLSAHPSQPCTKAQSFWSSVFGFLLPAYICHRTRVVLASLLLLLQHTFFHVGAVLLPVNDE
jgi:hypothetical protein